MRIAEYAAPDLLIIDEVGYLSYSNRHADLLFELISRRYESKSTLVTTNRPFADWREVFPNAACVVSMIDRLVHNAEISSIDGDSYRLKGAQGENRAARGPASARQIMSRRNRICLTCRNCRSPQHPGLPPALMVPVPTTWTPEVTVYELIDDLRDTVWAIYAADIQDHLRQSRT